MEHRLWFSGLVLGCICFQGMSHLKRDDNHARDTKTINCLAIPSHPACLAVKNADDVMRAVAPQHLARVPRSDTSIAALRKTKNPTISSARKAIFRLRMRKRYERIRVWQRLRLCVQSTESFRDDCREMLRFRGGG